jgi:hypothetical protein
MTREPPHRGLVRRRRCSSTTPIATVCTLTGLRFVRNQLGEDRSQAGFVEKPVNSGDGETAVAAGRWAHLPEPGLADLSAQMQSWEMTRYRAYEEWLAGNCVGRVFQRATDFLKLAAGRATASTLTGLR